MNETRQPEKPVRLDWRADGLLCPRCREPIPQAHLLQCETCEWSGYEEDDIVVLLSDPMDATHDELDHHHGPSHKAAQRTHFDEMQDETFEIERPHGTPRLYRFLLNEKFRRAGKPIGPALRGATALVVCGGSGMDAEFLCRAGAKVVSTDLSLGAAKRARERSRRFELGIESVVADVEQLPFPDESFDLVAVHDGLHHLADPHAGLSEMARVARRWILVTEPSAARLTRIAVRLGIARETEDAGNPVARMDPSKVGVLLEQLGFRVLHSERYAMYYPHHPGRIFRLLSHPILFPLVRMSWRVANAAMGRVGNKMVVAAERARMAHAVSERQSA